MPVTARPLLSACPSKQPHSPLVPPVLFDRCGHGTQIENCRTNPGSQNTVVVDDEVVFVLDVVFVEVVSV